MTDGPAFGQLMAKAERACKSARMLIELGDADGACNRAYYAMFDAARAALAAMGLSDFGRTHRGLMNAFSEHLVKTGAVANDAGRLLKRAESMRLLADYTGEVISLDDAREMVSGAEAFVAVIKNAKFGAD